MTYEPPKVAAAGRSSDAGCACPEMQCFRLARHLNYLSVVLLHQIRTVDVDGGFPWPRHFPARVASRGGEEAPGNSGEAAGGKGSGGGESENVGLESVKIEGEEGGGERGGGDEWGGQTEGDDAKEMREAITDMYLRLAECSRGGRNPPSCL